MTQTETAIVPTVNRLAGAVSPLEHWKRNFAANFLDVMFFSLALAFASNNTIIPLFIRQLGGSPLIVGLVPAIIQTGQMLPPLFAAPYVATLERKLPFLLKMTLGERLPWPILAVATILLAPRYPLAMLILAIVLLAIFGLSGGLCTPAWMDIVTRVTPMRMRGKLFGWSGSLSGLLGVGGGLAAERVLATFAYPYSFAACFAAASVCMLASFIALLAIREPVSEEHTPLTSVRDYVRQLPGLLRRDRDFSIFIVVRMLAALAGMATALVAIYATEQRGLPPSVVGRFTAWMLGTQVLTTPLFGMLADRHGYKSSLQFALLAQAVAMAMSRVVTTSLGFSLVFGLIGAATGLLFSTTLNLVVEFATPADRVTYLGLHGTLIAPSVLLAPLIGGALAEFGGYPLAFGVGATCGFIALVLLTFFVREPRHRQEALFAAQSPGVG
ncbi:MAG: MFS transporter [Herpetosiphon sp.]